MRSLIVTAGFAPVRRLRKSWSESSPPDVLLYNHYPLDPREGYEKLCDEYGVRLFDCGGDFGLHGCLNKFLNAERPEIIVTQDPDSLPDKDFLSACEAVLSDRTIDAVALNCRKADSRCEKTIFINNVECFSFPHAEHLTTVAWKTSRVMDSYGFGQPHAYVGGLESWAHDVGQLRVVYLKKFWDHHAEGFGPEMEDPEYRAWRLSHYNWDQQSFGSWLAGDPDCVRCDPRRIWYENPQHLPRVELHPGEEYLGVGYGGSNILDRAREAGCKVHGFEWSREHYLGEHTTCYAWFQRSKLRTWPFDVIEIGDLFDRAPDWRNFIEQLLRVLAPSGRILFMLTETGVRVHDPEKLTAYLKEKGLQTELSDGIYTARRLA